jgi:translation initiation factor 2 subunit 2
MELDYTTDELIERLYEDLDSRNSAKTNQKLIMERPILVPQNRKSCFTNFRSVCKNMFRDELDVKRYIDEELCCSSSIDSNGVMVIDGKFRSKNLEKPIINYLNTYVICRECGSNKTELIKKDRIQFLKCKKCLSEKAI